MSTLLCAVCGARIDATAKICGVCAAPNDAAHSRGIGRLGRPGRAEDGITLLKIAGAFVGVIFLLGVVSALVIPRLAARAGVSAGAFREMTKEEARTGAVLALRVAYESQQRYYQRNGRYASDLGALAAEGWRDPMSAYYEFFVAESGDVHLCIDAVPSPQGEAAGVRPLSVNEGGVLYAALGCPGTSYLFDAPEYVGPDES